MRQGLAVWRSCVCALGAIVGAGFASGREIAQFFARYGAWSWALIALACGLMALLSCRMMRTSSACGGLVGMLPGGKYAKQACGALLMTLYLTLCGSMTAASGELAALALPIRNAREIGALFTLCLCAYFCTRGVTPLAVLSQAMLPLLLLLYTLARAPCGEMPAFVHQVTPLSPTAPLAAVCYSALNVTLAMGVLTEAGKGCCARVSQRAGVWLFALLFLLMATANAALLAHPWAQSEALPMVAMLKSRGVAGYALCVAALYAAVATTLLSTLRGAWQLLGKRAYIAPISAFVLSLFEFSDIVRIAYPILGALCLPLLARMLFGRRRNTSR